MYTIGKQTVCNKLASILGFWSGFAGRAMEVCRYLRRQRCLGTPSPDFAMDCVPTCSLLFWSLGLLLPNSCAAQFPKQRYSVVWVAPSHTYLCLLLQKCGMGPVLRTDERLPCFQQASLHLAAGSGLWLGANSRLRSQKRYRPLAPPGATQAETSTAVSNFYVGSRLPPCCFCLCLLMPAKYLRLLASRVFPWASAAAFACLVLCQQPIAAAKAVATATKPTRCVVP